MNFRTKAILSVIILLCVVSTIYFIVPRRINADFYDSSIGFNQVIITKSYFDGVEKLPKLDDYQVTNQDDISTIRNMLRDIKITPLLFEKNNLPGSYYMITFRNLNEEKKAKIKIIDLSFVESGFRVYKLESKEAAERLNIYIESLIDSSK